MKRITEVGRSINTHEERKVSFPSISNEEIQLLLIYTASEKLHNEYNIKDEILHFLREQGAIKFESYTTTSIYFRVERSQINERYLTFLNDEFKKFAKHIERDTGESMFWILQYIPRFIVRSNKIVGRAGEGDATLNSNFQEHIKKLFVKASG